MIRAYVGLGSNLGDREATLRRALDLLAEEAGVAVAGVSAFRDTEPVDYVDQPRFLNAVAALDTDLAPRELLDRLLGIERSLGRRRDGPRFGPRTVDLDLLLYGATTIEEPGLRFPIPVWPSGASCSSPSLSWIPCWLCRTASPSKPPPGRGAQLGLERPPPSPLES